MRWFNVMLVALIAPSLFAADDKARGFRFDKNDLDKVPAGWKADRTGKGEGSVWKVVADATAPSKTGHVLAQTARGPDNLFNVCVADDTSYKNVEISVAFKAVAGDKDQGGGIVWRYQDANNYYVARMNPLEDNFRVYVVTDGKRVQMASKKDIKVPTGEWHTIKIKQVDDKIECYLDDKKHLDARDDTIQKPGKVGVWTKADAQSHFDSFAVKELSK